MAHEPETVTSIHPGVEEAPGLPETLKAWKEEAAELVGSLPSSVYDDIDCFVLTNGAAENTPDGRTRAIPLGELIRELPQDLRRRRTLVLCLLAYGLFRSALGLDVEEDLLEEGTPCRSAQGASHLASTSLEASHPYRPVLRAVRLSCDDDFRKLRLRPRESWRSAVGILSVIGAVTVLGLWNLVAPLVWGTLSLGLWAKAWAVNRLALGLLEVGFLPLFIYRRNLSPRNRGLLAYLWGIATAHLADPALGAAAGLGWLTLNLVGLILIALGGLSVLQKRLQTQTEAR
jgi:hypothetical protein